MNHTSATTSYNTAIGSDAGKAISTGIQNTILGSSAGDALTDADYNIAIGYQALTTDTNGHRTVAIGYQALQQQNFTASTDTYNTAVGMFAGQNNATGQYNTFIGYDAGKSNTSGTRNTAIGYRALDGYTGTGTSENTAVGFEAGGDLTSGTFNSFFGGQSGIQITSGSKNTILGRYNGNQGGLDIRTSSNHIVLSDGDGNPRMWLDGNGRARLGTTSGGGTIFDIVGSANTYVLSQNNSNATPYGMGIIYSSASPDNNDNQFLACTDSTTNRLLIWSDGDVDNHDNSYSGFSDLKLKEQIVDASSQWDDIKALTVRKFKFKTDVANGDSDSHWRLGVIAQELETAGMNGLVRESIDRDLDNNDLGTTTKSVKYSILYMKAVKALQEAMTRIETLEAKVATLEGE